jgi:hypothetical protein
MADLASFRQQYPQYNDMSDGALAVSLHKKFYSDLPITDYLGKLGLDRGNVLYDLRAPGDANGDYLRQQLAAPGQGETPQQAAVRQGGQITDRRAGTLEGIARAGLQGATFGFGDEAVAAGAAALNPDQSRSFGEKFNAYQGRESGLVDNFRQDNPVAAYGAEIAGAIPTSMAAGGQLAARGGNLLGRMGSGAAVGVGQGAVYGAGATDGGIQERAAGAGAGAIAGGVTGFAAPWIGNKISQGLQRGQQGAILNAAAKNAPASTELKTAASALFDTATGGQPLAINSNAYFRMLGDVKQVADKFRINPQNDPQAVGLLETLMRIADDTNNGVAVDLKDLHLIRQLAQNVAQSSSGRDKAFGSLVINKLDNFAQTLKPADILGGADPKAATNALFKGISTWSRANKVSLIEEAIRTGQVAASGPEKGIRNALRSVVKSPDWKLFTAAEKQAIMDVVEGTPGSNLAKLVGTFGFGGNTATNGVGGAFGMAIGNAVMPGVGMVAGPAIGALGKVASERMTGNLANRALGAVATEGLKVLPPLPAGTPTALEALFRRGALGAQGPLVNR